MDNFFNVNKEIEENENSTFYIYSFKNQKGKIVSNLLKHKYFNKLTNRLLRKAQRYNYKVLKIECKVVNEKHPMQCCDL